jgi:hypothetical protein
VLGCLSAAVFGLVVFPGVAGADFTITEGELFSGTVVDIGVCSLSSATIYWGDGTPTSAGVSDGGTGVQGSHTYADERTASGNVSYTCSNMVGTQTAYFTATVTDAALTGAGRNISGTAGQTLTAAVAHIADANPGATQGDFVAQVAWGDGTTSSASVGVAAAGGFDVAGTHTYTTAGVYPVNTSITDVGGESTSVTSDAEIAVPPNPPPRTIAPPVVSGEPREQETLATTTGTWSGAPTSFRYQWLRCASSTGSCTALRSATASTYSPVHADVGSVLRSSVLATNAAGTSLASRSAPTGIVQPLVVRARFTISPATTCTGLKTSFDASTSKTPDAPIVRYQFRWHTLDDYVGDLIGFHYDISPDANGSFTVPISDGPSPRATETFDWNNFYPRIGGAGGEYNVFAAFPVQVTLTVTDHAGATDTYSQTLDFAQFASTEARTDCPKQRLSRGVSGPHLSLAGSNQIVVTPSRVTLRLRCAGTADCAGRITLLRPSGHIAKAKAAALAGSRFFLVRAGRNAAVSANLTRLGRALRKGGRPIDAILRVETAGVTGHISTRSRPVTLMPGTRHQIR